MIIGSGLVARAFENMGGDHPYLIFASGVSNSSTATEEAYARERDLLHQYGGTGACLAYFSTCSVYDPTLAGSGYVRHKLAMEELTRSSFGHHVIFRLPNLIGQTRNPHTLVNHLWNNLHEGSPVRLYVRACRYMMDVRDMALACTKMMEDGAFAGGTININFDDPTPVPELLRYLELLQGRKALVTEQDSGSCYEVDNTFFKDFWTRRMGMPWPGNDHWRIALMKYYGEGPYGTKLG